MYGEVGDHGDVEFARPWRPKLTIMGVAVLGVEREEDECERGLRIFSNSSVRGGFVNVALRFNIAVVQSLIALGSSLTCSEDLDPIDLQHFSLIWTSHLRMSDNSACLSEYESSRRFARTSFSLPIGSYKSIM